MAEKVIAYKVKVNGIEGTAESFDDLKKSVSTLEGELGKAKFGSEKFKELQKELKNSKGALEEAQQSTMSLGEKFSSIPGPIGQVSQSVMGLGTAFKALIANPIGAIIAAIGAVFIGLYKAINSTEEGAFKFKQVMAALGGVLNPIIKLVGELGVLLVDGVLAGINAVQQGLAALGFDGFAKASEDAQKLAKSITDVEEAEGDLNVERAKQNKELAETREILADTNASLGDRQKALNKVKKSEEDLAAKETKLAKQALANVREQIKQRGKSAELLDAEEAALTKLYNTEQNQAAVRRKNTKAQQALDREGEADQKEAAAKAKERAKERAAQAEERKKQAKEAADFEKNLNLELIKDDFEKQKITIQNALDAQKEQINNLSVSEAKKAELRVKAEQNAQNKLNELDAKKKADDDKKAQEEQTKKDNEYKTQLDKETANINALLALDQMKYEKAEELSQEDLDNTIKLLDTKLQLELENARLRGASEAELQLIKETYANAEIKLAQDVDAKKKALDDERVARETANAQKSAAALGLIAEAAGETTAVGKLAALAQASINTYLSASEAYKSVVGVPVVGPVLGPAAAAAAIALGLKQVQTIMGINAEVPEPKFAGGGIVPGMGSIRTDNVRALLSPGESIINARSTAMFAPILDTINQAGGGDKFSGGVVQNGVDMTQMEMLSTMKNGGKEPVKAYVVGSQMSNQMMLDRQVKSRSLI